MEKLAWVGLVSAIVLAFISGGIYAFTERSHVAEAQTDPTVVGVDANPTGNTGTSLGTINGCISVESVDTGPGVPGPTFYIDLVVMDVTNLNSFDGSFRFDGSIVEVTGVDAVGPVESRYFLAAAPGSEVAGYYDSVPNSSGSFQVNAFDYAEYPPGAPESGEGILAKLEITAIGPGISKANFDWRPDGYPISGVQLFDVNGDAIGDLDEDDYFDGIILEAEIRVDQPCPGECLPDVDTDGDEFDDDVECYLPTDQNDDCPNNPSHDAWPLDIDSNGVVNLVGDVTNFVGKVGCEVLTSPECRRLDLNADGVINLGGDLAQYVGNIGDTCS